ncbi:MAG: Rrf2 family transcriptional regulator [Cyclobacteriaceae bacterium]
MFSKTCQYAIQAVLFISIRSEDNRPVGLKEIVESQDVPLHFLSKILQDLVKRGILNSNKGPTGGFSFRTSPKKLKLMDVVEVVDGTDFFKKCGIGLKHCSDSSPCPVHGEYQKIRAGMEELLTSRSIFDLATDVKNGEAIVSFR